MPKNTCIAVATSLLILGCNRDDAEIPFPEGIESIWAEMFAPYGLTPLFPVRTGVQPGDVVVLCRRATLSSTVSDKKNLDNSVEYGVTTHEWIRLFSLDGISTELAEHAKSRMQYHSYSTPATAASSPLSAASGPQPFSTGSDGHIAGFASFPAVLSYTQNRQDLGAGLPTGKAAIGAGYSQSRKSTYLLEIPAAEYSSLPHSSLQKALTKASENIPPHVASTLLSLSSAITSNDCLGKSLSVIGETFYSRRITVTMGSSSASALSARAAINTPADSARASVLQAVGAFAISAASSPASPASGAFPSEGERLARLMLDIDKIYQSADQNSKLGFAGIKIGYAKSDGQGISMDYSYAHPVAFGVRLYPIEINVSPGKIGLQGVLALTGSHRNTTFILNNDNPILRAEN